MSSVELSKAWNIVTEWVASDPVVETRVKQALENGEITALHDYEREELLRVIALKPVDDLTGAVSERDDEIDGLKKEVVLLNHQIFELTEMMNSHFDQRNKFKGEQMEAAVEEPILQRYVDSSSYNQVC